MQLVAEEFLSRLDRSPLTVKTYRTALSEFARWVDQHGADVAPESLILAYKQARMAAGKSAATIATDITALRAFGDYLVRTGRLAVNPAADVRAPKQAKQHRRDALTREQAVRLVGAVDTSTLRGKRDAAIAALMMRAGLRDIEIVRADVEDLRTVNGQRVLWVHGKGRDEKDEFVVLNEKAAAAVDAYLDARGPFGASSPLFVSVDKRGQGRLTTRQVNRIVSGLLEEAGLKGKTITPHSLRHTAATLAVEANVPLSQVQAMMRHADPRTTARYVHLHNRIAQAAENALDF